MGFVMGRLSRRGFFGSVAAATTAASWPSVLTSRAARADAPALVPRKLPFPKDEFGTYEPTISADGNTIWFARLANNGDKRVKGPSDSFVVHRINQSGEWPGAAEDWSKPERLPDTVNSDSVDQEPWITPDGSTLYFMSSPQSPGVGPNGIYFSTKQANGEWRQAQPVVGENINIPGSITHCFIPFELPGEASAQPFIGIRSPAPGGPSSPDIYTTRQIDGARRPAKRYADRLLDSIANKCRINGVTKDDLTRGVISVHDSDPRCGRTAPGCRRPI
jgi:hypothetical protein